MSALREIQDQVLRAIRSNRSLLDQPELKALAEGVARGSERLSPAEQLDIYREQFFLRHLGCMSEDFAGVEGLVGSEPFEELCRSYFEAHPPSSFTLRDLGERFASYLETAPFEIESRGMVIDMARLEWALVEAFDAGDVAPLEPEALQQIEPDAFDRATLRFDPSLTLLALRYPVHEIHEAAVERRDFELPAPRACHIGVYRRLDQALDWREIPAMAHEALRRLREGEALAAALDGVAAGLEAGEVELLTSSVGAWFTDWVQRGWVRGVEVGDGGEGDE